MKYHWVEDIEEFCKIARDWDEALIASGTYNPFLLSDFIITWWKYFNNNFALKIFVVYDDNKISGGIPLYIKRYGIQCLGTRIMYYIGGPLANYTEPFYIGPGSKILTLFTEALEDKTDWDAIYLPNVRTENRFISDYQKRGNDKRFIFYVIQDHFNLTIDLSAGKEKYMAAISKKLKKDLRQKRKHAIKDYGEIRFQRIKGQEGVGRYLDVYTKFSLNTFDERNRKSSFEDKRYGNFLKEFFFIMDQKDRLDTYVLFAGDKILAIIFGYRLGQGFNWALTSFNYEYKYVRPGYLLVEELINEIIRRGETFCNCYGYESFYKSQWCNKCSPLFRFIIMRRSFRGICYMAYQNLKKILRSSKIIVGAVRRIKQS